MTTVIHNKGSTPPDFELEDASRSRTWLEVSDVFIDDEDVDWLLSPEWLTRGVLENTDQKFVDQAIVGLRKKLRKSSYAACVERLGRGVLVLAGRYSLIDEVVLHKLRDALLAELVACADCNAFRVAYLQTQFGGEWRHLEIYPKVALS